MARVGFFDLRGVNGTIAGLRAFGKKFEGKAVRDAIRTGAKITQAKAKQLAPVQTGLLRKRIKVRAMKRKKGRIGITVTTSTKDYVGDTFYAPMVEYGHHVGSRSLPNRTFVDGEFFMKEAFDQTEAPARRAIIESLRASLRRGAAEVAAGRLKAIK
jgi:HK97 gp10 family phage protein